MMCKLIIVLYVVTVMAVQYSSTRSADDEENGTPVEWNKPQQFCGEFLEDLIQEICKGELSDKEENNLNKSLSIECCLLNCSPSDLKRHYCKDKRLESVSYIIVPKRNKTNSSDVVVTYFSYIVYTYLLLKIFLRNRRREP